jgi:hypothetical protein
MDNLDISSYNKNTTDIKFLKVISNLDLKGYELIKYSDYFFIWQKINNKKPISEYIRLTLIRSNDTFYSNKFYWDLELSFKPFAYKHNHRDNSHLKSELFLYDELDKFYNYFLNMIDRIKQYCSYK